MFVFSAVMIAKKGKEKELEEALSAMIPNVQNEEETLQYSLHRSRNNPGKFFFYEKYKDQAAFDFHCSTSYFKELFSKTPGLLEGEPEVEAFEEVTAIRR